MQRSADSVLRRAAAVVAAALRGTMDSDEEVVRTQSQENAESLGEPLSELFHEVMCAPQGGPSDQVARQVHQLVEATITAAMPKLRVMLGQATADQLAFVDRVWSETPTDTGVVLKVSGMLPHEGGCLRVSVWDVRVDTAHVPVITALLAVTRFRHVWGGSVYTQANASAESLEALYHASQKLLNKIL